MLLGSCATVKVPNTKVCAVAGIVSAGAICAHTLSDETETMTVDEFLDFLEPQLPNKGPALCQSADDWNLLKTALEQACEKLGDRCDYEQVDAIKKKVNTLIKMSLR